MLPWAGLLRLRVDLPGGEWVRGDLAILASEITNLAGLWLGGVARRHLSTLSGVKMAEGVVAVQVSTHWLVVDVVDLRVSVSATCPESSADLERLTERTAGCGEVGELDGELDTSAIGGCNTRHGAGDGSAIQLGGVGDARWVVGHDLRVAKDTSDGIGVGLRIDERQAREGRQDDGRIHVDRDGLE